jgi:DNA-binding NtrC family response regulator
VTLYRLRGEVGGVARSYVLASGENLLGSRPGSGVALPVRGVSRRHALIVVEPEGLTLEDLGSKNGTLVKGVRVQRTRLRVGDDVRLGPVTLRLEEVEPDDVEIGLAIEVVGAPDSVPSETTATPLDEPGRVSLAFLEDVVRRIGGRGETDLGAVVAAIGRGLGAESACALETRKGEPVAVATWGPPPAALHDERLARLMASASEEMASSVFVAGEPPLTCAVTRSADGERFGVAVAGALRLRPADVETALRIVVVLLKGLPAAPPGAGTGRAEATRLRFPARYVPGDSPTMRAFYAQLRPAVDGDLPVLILGETGVGKEFLARIVHDSSSRRAGPFVAVNCAAIPADLLEAEMFGIRRGVATGVAERRGRFELAHGGTLFLDEVGEMPLLLQAKMLRALQEKEVQPLGGPAVPIDVRVVAATNSDLPARMEDGRFRRDLYFRLAGLSLHVPPLRERREDLPALVHAFLGTFAREAGKGIRGITVKALRSLLDYPWPGNVRELEHEVRRLVHLCPEGSAIDATMLPARLAAAPPAPARTLDLRRNLDALEAKLIADALAGAGGNRTRAARELGISRNGLATKMTRFGIRD